MCQKNGLPEFDIESTQNKQRDHDQRQRSRFYFEHRGIHILNTPATSFVAKPEESTTGWTMAKLTDGGGDFA